MARVSLEQVTKAYPGSARPAVNHLSLDIEDREFIVIVGPSGCGKSTTLRLIAGLEKATSGTIRIDQRVVNDVQPRDRDIAMVFQNYALYPFMTVFGNMAFALNMQRRKLGISKEQIRAQVVEAAELLGLTGLLERRPRELSGGERQRVAVGRAIVRHPKAFLFDEPLSNLDATLRVETRGQLKRLHRRLRTTTIYVTHDQEEAMTLGDRIVVMKEGIIQQCAPPLTVYQQPANRFVAGFVGTPPMNFLNGKIEVENTAAYFAFGKHRIRLPQGFPGQTHGQLVTLGIRPEAIGLRREGKYDWDENSITAKVNVVEPLGEKVDIALTIDGLPGEVPLICRVDSDLFGKTHPDGIICLFMDLGRVHLFEPGDNGVNLTLTRESSHAVA